MRIFFPDLSSTTDQLVPFQAVPEKDVRGGTSSLVYEASIWGSLDVQVDFKGDKAVEDANMMATNFVIMPLVVIPKGFLCNVEHFSVLWKTLPLYISSYDLIGWGSLPYFRVSNNHLFDMP